MTVVVDASAIVAFLIDGGPEGQWAEGLVVEHDLVAPHLLPAEVASTLRRSAQAGIVGPETATLAHQDLCDLDIELFRYDAVAARVWELRETVTPYDAWYVALAEELRLPLATADRRLARAPGLRCELLMFEERAERA